MGVARIVGRRGGIGVLCAQADVAVGDQRAAEGEGAGGRIAEGVAELVPEGGGIDEVVPPPDLAHGRGFKEAVPARQVGRHGRDGARLDGEHVGGVELDHGAALHPLLGDTQDGEKHRRAVIQPHPAVLDVDGGIEGKILLRIGVQVDLAVIGEGPGGAVGHGAADRPALAGDAGREGVVQVVLAVGRAADVGGVHASPALIGGVVALFVDDALVPPVAQIVRRRRPRHVVVHAEGAPLEPVVGAVDIHSSVKDVRFAVGDVFPARQIWIEHLTFHVTTSRKYL